MINLRCFKNVIFLIFLWYWKSAFSSKFWIFKKNSNYFLNKNANALQWETFIFREIRNFSVEKIFFWKTENSFFHVSDNLSKKIQIGKFKFFEDLKNLKICNFPINPINFFQAEFSKKSNFKNSNFFCKN